MKAKLCVTICSDQALVDFPPDMERLIDEGLDLEADYFGRELGLAGQADLYTYIDLPFCPPLKTELVLERKHSSEASHERYQELISDNQNIEPGSVRLYRVSYDLNNKILNLYACFGFNTESQAKAFGEMLRIGFGFKALG